LLENASVTYINTSRWIIDYGYFNHAHMLKKGKDGKIVMMYMNYTNEFPLPDRNLGLYVADSFVFDLQRKEEAPHRSASIGSLAPRSLGTMEKTPFQKALPSSYTGFDQAGPSQVHQPYHTSWDQPGSSHMHQPRHARWEQPSLHHLVSSWHQGSSAQ
jgi:hypothetical protein